MTGFFAILDDIATLMDDVAVMTKVAGKKTAGILGDDLAVGAKQASDFSASRELPVLWAITKGSFLNKLIILPFAFLLSAFAPKFIVPILLIGGVYLSFEGIEKIVHSIFNKHKGEHKELIRASTKEELLVIEKSKIKKTIITDFILSVEIIMIALGSVADQDLTTQIMVVSIIALAATIGVYGLVALMVRMDDSGYKLIALSRLKDNPLKSIFSALGKALVWSLPKLIQVLAVVGTLAMLLVGGGMFLHNIPKVHDFFHGIPFLLSELIMGIVVGLITYALVQLYMKIKNSFSKQE